jgi:hypothetical protein
MDARQPRAERIALTPVYGGGMIRFQCYEDDCAMLSDLLHIAIEPVASDGDIRMIGIIQYDACPHYLACEHMATRVGLILEAIETHSLTPEMLCGLGEYDHEHLGDEDPEGA